MGAIAMLVLGQTLLKSYLDGAVFIFYWLACFLLTGLTMITALIDARAVRQAAREQQHDLLRNTLEKINRVEEEKSDSSPVQKNPPD
jgi:hypothetical protein